MIIDIILYAFLFYLYVVIHEFCHLLVYKAFKVKIRIFYVFPFGFRKRSKTLLNINVLGLVLPSFNTIGKNEKKIIFLSLISAPLMHTVSVILGAIFYLLLFKQIGLYILTINIIMLLSSFIENEKAIGDSLAAIYILISHNKSIEIFKGFLIDGH